MDVRERVKGVAKDKDTDGISNTSLTGGGVISLTDPPEVNLTPKQPVQPPQKPAPTDQDATIQQPDYISTRFLRVLMTTWAAYATYIISRKPFTVVRVDVQQELDMTTFISGMIDTAYHSTYCVGQIFYASLKGKYSSKFIIALGLFGACACCAVFAMTSNQYLMVLVWGFNGLFGSLGWPSCVSVVTPWLAAKERGKVMGIWGSCQAVGSLLANWLVAGMLIYGWRSSYMGLVVIIGVVSAAVGMFLLEHPNRCGMASPSQWKAGMRQADVAAALQQQSPVTVDGEIIDKPNEVVTDDGASKPNVVAPMTTADIARLPSVMDMSVCYFCQKLVRYSLMSWLPYYLTKELGYSTIVAGYVASSFDFGGIVGSILSGVFSDWYHGGRRRMGACSIYITAGIGSLLLFNMLKMWMRSSMVLTCILSCLIGFFIFGCDTLMTGATIQDLADRLKVPHHAGSISGVVGGIGSAGSILQGPIMAMLAENYGWSSVFYFLILLSSGAYLLMLRPMALERRGNE